MLPKMIMQWFTAVCTVLILSVSAAPAAEKPFDEHATEVIYNSLQTEPPKSFLKHFYTQLLFLPAWMHEKGPSPAAKGLFEAMKEDFTLDPQSRLYNDARDFEVQAQMLYENGSTFLQKMEMEFKITMLYKAYTDYAYFGSINWGAFQARIVNLKVNGVSTEWVLHRPDVDPIGMVEKALLGADLKKELQDAVPTAYHYRALQRALKHYMSIEADGGWAPVRLHVRKLNPGKRDPGVYTLRERLRVTGEYSGCSESNEGDFYDFEV